MKQTLHIFLKDVRHFWIEILVSVTLVAAFAWIYPKQWWDAGFIRPLSQWSLLAGALKVLLVISWWLLIARVIHDESLVGNREFWLTRPYDRKSLLAAKALFLFCFLYVPLIVAQLLLLAQAGFNPFAYIPGLLYNLLLISAFLVLPVAAIAAVTSNLVRMTLTILGICLCTVALVAIVATELTRGVIQSSVSTHDSLSIPTIVCVCAAAIAVQYAARRARLARGILLALPPVLVLFTVIFTSAAVVNRTYPPPAANQPPPIVFSIARDVATSGSSHQALNRKQVAVELPVDVSGLTDDEIWETNGVRIDVQAPDGTNWRSVWQGQHLLDYRPGRNARVYFYMSRKVFDRVQSTPVTLHLNLAVTLGRRARVWTTPIPTHDFAVPGIGVCSPQIDRYRMGEIITGISCREAFREPELTFVETSWTQGPCKSPASEIKSYGWAGNLKSAPAKLGLSPVNERRLSLSLSLHGFRPGTRRPRFCPGTPITFTQYRAVRRFQTELTVQNFRFPSYDARTDLSVSSR